MQIADSTVIAKCSAELRDTLAFALLSTPLILNKKESYAWYYRLSIADSSKYRTRIICIRYTVTVLIPYSYKKNTTL